MAWISRARVGRADADSLPEAWVLGDLDVVKPLSLAGIPCVISAPPGSPGLVSRQARPGPWADPWDEEAPLLDLLISEANTRSQPPVLFYQLDAYTSFVSRHREALSRHFRFILADAQLLKDCLDKSRFHALAEGLGLPVPRSRELKPSGDPLRDLDLRFPIVLKPSLHGSGWNAFEAKRKAIRVDSLSELKEMWSRLVALGQDVLAQELVPGPEDRIESYHAYRTAEGHIAGEFTGRKVRTYPQVHGYTTALTVLEIPDVRELGRAIVNLLGVTGVVKLDMKRAPDGRLFLLEANLRFNLWHHPGAYAGVNLPALVWSDLTGLPAPRSVEPRDVVSWMNLRDLQAAQQSGVPLGEWLRWARRCEAKSVISLGDPRPTLPLLVGAAKRALAAR